MSVIEHEKPLDADSASEPDRLAPRSATPADAEASPTPAGPPSTVADSLYLEAVEQFRSGRAPDEIWVELASSALCRAIADAEADDLARMQNHYRRLLDLARRAAGTAKGPDRQELGSLAQQMQVLLHVADAGADLTRPRALGLALEPQSHAAKILAILARDRDVFADDLAQELDVHATQISRACRKLTDQGLIIRRQLGRRACWSLTDAGTAAAEAAARPAPAPATEQVTVPVQASTAAEFDEAVREAAPAIEVLATSNAVNAARWTATYLRVRNSRQAVGKNLLRVVRPPDVLVADEGTTAYVLAGLATASRPAQDQVSAG